MNATIFKEEEEEEEDKKEDERDDTPRGLGLQTKGLGFESKKKKKRKRENFGGLWIERTNAFFFFVCVDNKITPVITTESELGLAEPWFPSLKVTLLSRFIWS